MKKIKNDEKILCACFGITHEYVENYFDSPNASLEKLTASTKLGTKCSACLLDLDLTLESMRISEKVTKKPKSQIFRKPLRMNAARSMIESGFFINSTDVETIMRVANLTNLFSRDSEKALIPFNWDLKLFGQDGSNMARRSGKIEIGDTLELNFKELASKNSMGWFWLALIPLMRGLYGSIRPQFSLVHRDWVSSVHTQPHGTSCRLKNVLVKVSKNKTSAKCHVINSNQYKKNLVTFSLAEVGSDTKPVSSTIGFKPNSCKLVDLDEIFNCQSLRDGYFDLSVSSSEQCRKHIVLTQKSGALSIDHFPDRR